MKLSATALWQAERTASARFSFSGQVAEGGLQRFDDLRLKGRVHRPDGQRTGKAGRMGVRNIKIELQAVLTIITKYGNALGSTVDPAAKLTIPALHLKDRRGVGR